MDTQFDTFWHSKGLEHTEIVKLMSLKEDWALDEELGRRLDAFAEQAVAAGGVKIESLAEQYDFVQLQAWLTSEKALMLASVLDEGNPNLIVNLLKLAGETKPIGEPLTLFIERIATFSRARLIIDLFNENRVRRIEQLIYKVMNNAA